MKKLIFILLIGIFIISFGSSFDWNNGLPSYYKFDDNLSSTVVIDSTLNDDGVAGDNTNIYNNINGIINSSFDFNATNEEFVSIDDLSLTLNGTTTGSWSLWINTSNSTQAGEHQLVFFGNSISNEKNFFIRINAAGTLSASNDDWEFSTDNKVINDNIWHNIVLVQNGTNPVLYVDGDIVTITFSVEIDKTSWFNTATYNTGSIARFSRAGFTGNYYTGKIDEVGFWNRNLSSTEVTELYNNGNGLAFMGSTGIISVTLNDPLDNSLLSSNVTFNSTITPPFGLNLTNATIFIWDSNDDLFFTQTNIITGNLSHTTTFNVTNLSIGDYKWNVLGSAINSTGTLFSNFS